MSEDFVDATGKPRPQDQVEAALLWVKKRIIRPDLKDPEGVIHCVTIKDALEELLALRRLATSVLWCPQCGQTQTDNVACKLCGGKVQSPPTEGRP